MLKQQTKRPRMNIRLYHFAARGLVPIVLLVGLLVLAVAHFSNLLKITETQIGLSTGTVTYSVGPLASQFDMNGGGSRPTIQYAGYDVLTYVEWSSYVSADGLVRTMWDAQHGYSKDAPQRAVYSTASGHGWQVTQITKLVDERTVVVEYYLTAVQYQSAQPAHVELTILHERQDYWFNPAVTGTTFSASVLAKAPKFAQGTPSDRPQIDAMASVPAPLGTISVKAEGPYLEPNGMSMQNYGRVVLNPTTTQGWASKFETRYAIDNPLVDKLTYLGRETITFTPGG